MCGLSLLQFLDLFLYVCEYVCLSICMCVYVGIQGDKKRVLDALELELLDDCKLSYLSAG